jgi:hypothetical protein
VEVASQSASLFLGGVHVSAARVLEVRRQSHRVRGDTRLLAEVLEQAPLGLGEGLARLSARHQQFALQLVLIPQRDA